MKAEWQRCRTTGLDAVSALNYKQLAPSVDPGAKLKGQIDFLNLRRSRFTACFNSVSHDLKNYENSELF